MTLSVVCLCKLASTALDLKFHRTCIFPSSSTTPHTKLCTDIRTIKLIDKSETVYKYKGFISMYRFCMKFSTTATTDSCESMMRLICQSQTVRHVIHEESCFTPRLHESCHTAQVISYTTSHVITHESCHTPQVMSYTSRHTLSNQTVNHI